MQSPGRATRVCTAFGKRIETAGQSADISKNACVAAGRSISCHPASVAHLNSTKLERFRDSIISNLHARAA